MIKRNLSTKLASLAEQYPVVSLTGPRQTGKTTLVKAIFPGWGYISLEEPDIREFALTDPRGFIEAYPRRTILDEVQQECLDILRVHLAGVIRHARGQIHRTEDRHAVRRHGLPRFGH